MNSLLFKSQLDEVNAAAVLVCAIAAGATVECRWENALCCTEPSLSPENYSPSCPSPANYFSQMQTQLTSQTATSPRHSAVRCLPR
jgi:hypothetical protein